MTCESSSDELVDWQRQEIRDLRELVRKLQDELFDTRTEAAEMRGSARFWRSVAERVGVSGIDVAAVNRRILDEKRAG
jgi:hypothetical protein